MTVSFSTLDLNLLRVFDAVMEERSVLRASQKVCLSQSAVSHSLARLREMLDDELFIRTTTGMQPTARAVAMAGMVRDALKSLEAAIELPRFEPATSTRKFTIAANDFTTMVLAPRLLQMLRTEAPHVDLAIKPVTRIDLAEQIDLGRIDAAIGTFQGRLLDSSPASCSNTTTFSSRMRRSASAWSQPRCFPRFQSSSFHSEVSKRALSRVSSPNAAWRGDPKCTTGPRSNAQCPLRNRRQGSQSLCPIFSRFRASWTVQGYRQSFLARSPMPSPATTRFRSTNFPIPPPVWRSARSGTSATKATPRRTGCTMSCGGRRSICAPVPRRSAINNPTGDRGLDFPPGVATGTSERDRISFVI